MVITGTAIFVEPGSAQSVLEHLEGFPSVTFHVMSESRAELVVTMEAADHLALEHLCDELKERIPQIVEIAHVYVNFEEEIEKIAGAGTCRRAPSEPESQERG